MSADQNFTPVFQELKSILEPYASQFNVKHNNPDHYYLEGKYSEKWKKELFFASTQVKKNYVSFYLMPVYMYPDLLEQISPALKKRMQGKSCFNFRKPEPELFKELAELTRRGAQRFAQEFQS